MKKIYIKYKNNFNELIKNGLFVGVIILVSILSFGFTFVNYSIGVDDTCLDRYYDINKGYNTTNMLTSGRWGSFLIYNILQITEFTPFWIELVAVLIIDFTAIVICAFIKKNYGHIVKSNFSYIAIAAVYISYPLINEAFIYQSSIIAILIGNLAMIAISIVLYENYLYSNNKSIFVFATFLLPFFISMYEGVVQTYLLLSAVMTLLIIYETKDNKKAFKYLCFSVILLGVGIIINSIIINILHLLGVQSYEAAEKNINWGKYGIIESIRIYSSYIINSIVNNRQYLPVNIFYIITIIGTFIAFIETCKKTNLLIYICYFLMILSNFSISAVQLDSVMYRTCISWSLFVALNVFIIYVYIQKDNVLKTLGTIVIIFLVLIQTKDLNQWFYNDYIRYQRDLNIAFDLIYDLEKNYNLEKPLVVLGNPQKGIGKSGNQVNSLSVLWWGRKAFDSNEEFIKFLNSLGYKFKLPSEEQYEKTKGLGETMTNYPKEGSILELEDCIVINF